MLSKWLIKLKKILKTCDWKGGRVKCTVDEENEPITLLSKAKRKGAHS